MHWPDEALTEKGADTSSVVLRVYLELDDEVSIPASLNDRHALAGESAFALVY